MARVKKAAGTPESVEKSSLEFEAKVDAAIQSAAKETEVEQARAVTFASANAAKEKPIDSRYPPLVERTMKPIEWLAVIDRYEAWLELGDRRTEEAFVRKARDMGPKIVQDLIDTWIQAKYAREVWELENDAVFGSLRAEATALLQAEKDRGVRTKQITEKDVDSKCAAVWPDEWARQESKRLRFKLTEDRARMCIENAQLRCRMLEKA